MAKWQRFKWRLHRDVFFFDIYLNIEDQNVHSEIIMIIREIDLRPVWRASDGARGRLRSTTVNINMRMFLLHSKSHFKGVIHFPRIVG